MTQSIYIAGPMRGYPEFNFPAFYAAEDDLVLQGITVFNPARHDIEDLGMCVDGLTGDMSELPDFDLIDALRWDVQRVLDADAIYMLQGWENSTGARAEHALAIAAGKEIIYAGAS